LVNRHKTENQRATIAPRLLMENLMKVNQIMQYTYLM
jgi:hypothetical protein